MLVASMLPPARTREERAVLQTTRESFRKQRESHGGIGIITQEDKLNRKVHLFSTSDMKIFHVNHKLCSDRNVRFGDRHTDDINFVTCPECLADIEKQGFKAFDVPESNWLQWA